MVDEWKSNLHAELKELIKKEEDIRIRRLQIIEERMKPTQPIDYDKLHSEEKEMADCIKKIATRKKEIYQALSIFPPPDQSE